MEGGIFLCHWYFLLTAYLQKRREPKIAEDQNSQPVEMSDLETDHRDVPDNPVMRSGSKSEEV
jgi:hypothetical protein